jgi:putative molybdopterin biosynthesis protein
MRLLKAKMLAEMLGVSEARAYELMREKILPTVRLGRQVRVSENALEQFVASGGKALPGGWRREPDRADVG